MQNEDSQNKNDNELHDLRSLWQESTTQESINIKETAMFQKIYRPISNFELEFGTGKDRTLVAYSILTGVWAFSLFKDIQHNAGIYEIAFHTIAMFFGIGMVLFHYWIRKKTSHYDQSSLQDYMEMNLWRVEQQLILEYRVFPAAMIILFVFLTLYLTDDLNLSNKLLFGTVMVILFLGLYAYRKNRVKDLLKPLRDKLQSALQQLNEH